MASSQTHGDGEAGDGWLVEVFNAIDSNGSGQLDAKNIREALKAAGLPSSKDVVIGIIVANDDNGTGTIDVNAFKNGVSEQTNADLVALATVLYVRNAVQHAFTVAHSSVDRARCALGGHAGLGTAHRPPALPRI